MNERCTAIGSPYLVIPNYKNYTDILTASAFGSLTTQKCGCSNTSIPVTLPMGTQIGGAVFISLFGSTLTPQTIVFESVRNFQNFPILIF